MTDKIRVNSTIYSWNSCSFKIDGVPYEGILSLDYAEKRERKIVHAARRQGTPLGKTAGKYSVEPITMTMLRDSWHQKLKPQLATKGLGSYGDAEFTMFMQAIEPVPGAVPMTTVINSCTIDGVKDTQAEGVEELLTELTIGALFLTVNGMPLWSVVRSLGV